MKRLAAVLVVALVPTARADEPTAEEAPARYRGWWKEHRGKPAWAGARRSFVGK